MKRRLQLTLFYVIAAVILLLAGTCGILLVRPQTESEQILDNNVFNAEAQIVKTGEPLMVPVSTPQQPVAWESSDESVVTVDSGGRLDAVEAGTASVTAKYANGRTLVYSVTVEQSGETPAADTFSTAITANEDILTKNMQAVDEHTPELFHLLVNREQNVVTAYTYDDKGEYTVPVRAMVCSCGLNKGTITGEFHTFYHDNWDSLFNDVFGKYVTGIDGNYLFHSVPYTELGKSDTLETEEYNKLGVDASLGCVRLAVADAKWIFDNCPVGTYVHIYDSDAPEPLGKPQAMYITDHRLGWDPTDDDAENPYNEKKPEISVPSEDKLSLNASFDALQGVHATDTCGNDITDKIEVIGNVVTSHRGEYRVTYRVTDAMHRTAEQTRIIFVNG